ncbi:UDP-N-acetyl-D-galactosamine dehydrogenase [Litoreibacter meonggei]|uniref:UDP-N-acetyl-D-galactosamine dehydrogenase n=1 Tax=Litoreibacter meonggei TaxID=1049199 RepID=A0A497X3G2_9RHOB|nr:nucleotide sugar dehydrogenase [Litoreibacter meonggei]RLJ59539.1 UDP-N-acetyl-D-galactosamine dehydrogenase [Litoreibacter meonggei]
MNVMLNTALKVRKVERPDAPIRLVLDNAKTKAMFENIAVVGLGYVGLPLAVCLADQFNSVTGFDISEQRVAEINHGYDATNELDTDALLNSGLDASTNASSMANASFFIVTVPTPINDAHQPDLSPLESACNMIGPHLKKGDVVVFESTVYPGVTEDYCAPILERMSGLTASKDFGLGYSPERINPGDKVNTVENTIKVVSGDSPETLERVKAVYNMVIKAGLHVAPTIKVAEASKVLENTQRDINIALMNEMSQICDKVGISTSDVIEAAGTKWNFLKFTPGLVGGHCIGVDPYYLASLAEKVGHNPQVILAGRRTNDGMVRHVADATLKLLIERGGDIRGMRVGVCGISFKENVPDIRNSKSVELVEALRGYGITPLVHDTHCSHEVAKAAGVELCSAEEMSNLDAMVLATPHSDYTSDPYFLRKIQNDGILVDVRGVFRSTEEAKALRYWSL